MQYDPKIHQRRSVRLHDYDYSSPGAYYVTICTEGKSFLFGRVVDGQMHRNNYGDVAQEEWFRSGKLRHDVVLDAFIVMPNHIHGIIIRRGTARRAPTVCCHTRWDSEIRIIGSSSAIGNPLPGAG